jgi:hypothetical protein
MNFCIVTTSRAAIGVTDDMEPDVPAEPVQLESSDVVLNCTDGLWGQMSEAKSRKPSR